MIEAIYFDGQGTRRHAVTMIVHKGVLAMRGAGLHRTIRVSQLDISERLTHAPRILRFPDGGFIETGAVALDKLLAENGYRDPWVVRWQQNWLLSLLALIALFGLLISAYQWGVPWTVDKLAQHLPATLEKKIGDHELKVIDARFMAPSTLAAAEQARLRQLFATLKPPHGDNAAYRLEFRDSRIGPNAFALPNGVIVMTDQLVQLANNDHAVLGVLGHELGHVQRRHALRRLLQALGIGVVLNLWIGDVSSVLAAVPTFLLDQKYSRDFEREADRYAIAMMHANGLPLSPMADLFEKMAAADAGKPALSSVPAEDEDKDEPEQPANMPAPKAPARKAPPEYFSSHPSDVERIARLRAADGR